MTIDPFAPAPVVSSPEIAEIRSIRTGRLLDARDFIASRTYQSVIRLRGLIREAIDAGRARLACAVCSRPVYIVASPLKQFFFRHTIEDGACPARTRDGLTEAEIRAMKYRGAQESEPHTPATGKQRPVRRTLS